MKQLQKILGRFQFVCKFFIEEHPAKEESEYNDKDLHNKEILVDSLDVMIVVMLTLNNVII